MLAGVEYNLKKIMDEGVMIGIEKGKQEGKQEGVMEGRLEDARRMIKRGFDTETIADITQLSSAEIEQLREELAKEAQK